MNTFPPRRILVALDLSAPSLCALDAAKALARKWGSRLDVVRVHYAPVAAAGSLLEGASLPVPPDGAQTEAQLQARLEKAVAGFPRGRLQVHTIFGWPPRRLVRLGSPRSEQMIVMGTHGYAGLDRFLLGSVAEWVIRHSRVPVLAVHERKAPLRLSRVLAPWNGRPYATRALRYALQLARSLGARLEVLYVLEGGGKPAREQERLERRLTAALGRGRDWSLKVRSGDARAHILREAGSGRYGLVVLAAHRRPAAADVVLGSTVERALRHSQIPVLAVPSGPRPGLRVLPRAAAWAAGRIFAL